MFLAVLAGIVGPMSLLTSFYGMNVQELVPGTTTTLFEFWQIGIPVLLITSVSVAFVTLWMITDAKKAPERWRLRILRDLTIMSFAVPLPVDSWGPALLMFVERGLHLHLAEACLRGVWQRMSIPEHCRRLESCLHDMMSLMSNGYRQ